MEIERKFLLTDTSYRDRAIAVHTIKQGYISKMPGRTVRVRIYDDTAILTVKIRTAGTHFTRHEWEYEISMADAIEMLQLSISPLIEKKRWIIPATSDDPNAQLIWEIDEFEGRLQGLTLAEIELTDESQVFDKPSFIGEEVTGDPRYYNANM